jgi:hypothetical protein
MLNHPEAYGDCIIWDALGEALIIYDSARFRTEVLPKLYGQSQFASFTRSSLPSVISPWNCSDRYLARGLGQLNAVTFHNITCTQ